jgi:TIR domain/Restriction endonuclease
MPDQEFEYDVFLSHAGEDTEWCETLAERLRNEGVRLWFDKWELQPGDNLLAKLNGGLAKSRKMVAVWSANYFRDGKVWTLVESFSQLHGDPLSQERPIIPLLIEDCTILPTFRNILFIDFRNKPDFDLRFRQLLQALDLPRREFEREPDFEFREHDFDATKRGRLAQKKGKRFEDEIAKLYELLGFTIKRDTQLHGFQIDLQIEKREGGLHTQAIVECKDKRLTADDRNQILAQQNLVQKKVPRFRWIALSSQSFAADTRAALEEAGVDCTIYPELLRELVPLDRYVENLIAEYEAEVGQKWHGEDWFIRPNLRTEVSDDKLPALSHFAKWLGSDRSNFLVLLGDLGTGKSTLARFLAYNLAKSFVSDPLRHPAPVLIPLKDVRKENSLESMIISHFSKAGLPGINFPRFEHLVRLG